MGKYEDLIKRLKNSAQWADKGLVITPSICLEAADAIEELTRRCEQFQYMPPPAWFPVTEQLPKAERKSYWVCTDTGYQCECR